MNNKPLTKFRDKGISITIWSTANGGFNASLSKSYKRKEDTEWTNVPSKDKPSLSLFEEELRIMSKLCLEAADWMHGLGEEKPFVPAPISEDEEDLPWG